MTDVPHVVVFGLHVDGRPHAACFAERDATLAIKAARYLGSRFEKIINAGLAEALSLGNVFAPRNAFAPQSAARASTGFAQRPRKAARQQTARGSDGQ